MKPIALPLPEVVGIAATRGMLAAGVALLFGDRLAGRQRQLLGIILTAIGVVSTLPFALDVLHRRHR